jgi:hypothetical protein
MGSVYMFNNNGEAMSNIAIRSNLSTVKIPGWSHESTTKFQPIGLPFERTKLPIDDAVFAQGENSVSFRRPTNSGSFVLNIPAELALSDDLILYVARDFFLLMRTSGERVQEGTFAPKLFKE